MKQIKGFVIAATKSGSGKTTISLGMMAALMKRGLSVAPFKVGPDFIDPGHHGRITGRISRNLDGWMLSASYNKANFSRFAADADIAVVEGVMGLFDGFDGRSEAGSTAQMAKWLGLPVVLVVDAKSMARSAAALLQGFERFDPDLTFAGVVFNNVGSQRHLQYLKDAVKAHVAMPCLGGFSRDEALVIPERHLGLMTHEDHPLSQSMTDRLANAVEKQIDMDKLLESIDPAPLYSPIETAPSPAPQRVVRIGVARDRAFCFYYPDNFDLLSNAGAELVFFSPLAETSLPVNLDGLYFGGGYPELFAAQLSKNGSLRSEIRKNADAGMPIYGECGGFMYLCSRLVDIEGRNHEMTGCFPFTTRMFPRLKSLGYREVTITDNTLAGPAGGVMRGHEFHYSGLAQSDAPVKNVYRVTTRLGVDAAVEGYGHHACLGSYIHLHFGSRPETARDFVAACAAFKKGRNNTNET